MKISKEIKTAIENAIQHTINKNGRRLKGYSLERMFWVKQKGKDVNFLIYQFCLIHNGKKARFLFCVPEGGILNANYTKFVEIKGE